MVGALMARGDHRIFVMSSGVPTIVHLDRTHGWCPDRGDRWRIYRVTDDLEMNAWESDLGPLLTGMEVLAWVAK